MEAQTTISLTPDLLTSIEELKPYDQEYGITVRNLLAVVQNQLHLFCREFDETTKISFEERGKLLRTIWETEDLVKIITSKVNDDLFRNIDDLIYNIEEQVKQD